MNDILLLSLFSSFIQRCAKHFLLVLILIGPITSCTYQVDSFLDLPDADPGDLVCNTGTGECTLRAAIMEVNAFPGLLAWVVGPTILFPEGTYTLNLPLSNGGGSLQISDRMSIQGSGASNTTINQTVSNAVIVITEGPVALNNLTIQGGDLQAGGGIFVDNALVEITDVVIEDNFGFTGGGGLYVIAQMVM